VTIHERPTPRVPFDVVQDEECIVVDDITAVDGIVVDELPTIAQRALSEKVSAQVKRGEFATLRDALEGKPSATAQSLTRTEQPAPRRIFKVAAASIVFIAICACVGYLVGG